MAGRGDCRDAGAAGPTLVLRAAGLPSERDRDAESARGSAGARPVLDLEGGRSWTGPSSPCPKAPMPATPESRLPSPNSKDITFTGNFEFTGARGGGPEDAVVEEIIDVTCIGCTSPGCSWKM